jgi:hypothetical protein
MTEFPICCCFECYAPYRREQWAKLELVKKDGDIEWRKCSECGLTLRTDAAIGDKVDLRVPKYVLDRLYGRPF